MSSLHHVQTYLNLQDLKTGKDINCKLNKHVMTASGNVPRKIPVHYCIF